MRGLFGILLLAALVRAEDPVPRLRSALVKVEVVQQGWDYASPWNKASPRPAQGRGFLVSPGVVLTTAANLRNALMVEVTAFGSARRFSAKIRHVDARMNLALLDITDAALAGQMQPLEIGGSVRLDDEFDIYQLGGDNTVERATGRVVRADNNPSQLLLQLKTTCSDPGNGQVALREGKVAGLLVSTNPGRQDGTLLSVETIRHFLADFDDGKYDGCPGGGIWIQPMLRPDLRAHYGMKEEHHGLGVARVIPGRTGDGVLRPGDVILRADGYDLDDEGRFVHELHGRLNSNWLFQGRRYAGEKMPLTILRGGVPTEVEVELRPWPNEERRVPSIEGRPPFLVAGGLVLLELSQEATNEIGRSPGGVILRRYREREGWDAPDGRMRIVYADRVLADPSNKGMENEIAKAAVESVNGTRITRLADVVEALKRPQGGFHVFRFEGVFPDYVIDASKLEEIDRRIAKTYRVSRARWLPGDPD